MAKIKPIFLLLLFSLFTSLFALSPLEANGKLTLKGVQLVGEHGKAVQLRGWSTHGFHWLWRCTQGTTEGVNAKKNKLFQSLRDDWGASVLRAAMYVREGGYVDALKGNGYDKFDDDRIWNLANGNFWDPVTGEIEIDNYTSGNIGYQKRNKFLEELEAFVNFSEKFGMYVIIDWHILATASASYGDPRTDEAYAIRFWKEIAQKFKNKKNVLYEIANEPSGGVNWSGVRSYANNVISAIRAIDSETIIIVGTPNYSQHIDDAASNPVSKPYNVMYALHFYACDHYFQDQITNYRNKVPIFVTEWGGTAANGDGAFCQSNSTSWLNLLKETSTQSVSWAAWQFSDNLKFDSNGNSSGLEGTSALQEQSCVYNDFSSASSWGSYVKGRLQNNSNSWDGYTKSYHTLPTTAVSSSVKPSSSSSKPNSSSSSEPEVTGDYVVVEDFQNTLGDAFHQSTIAATVADANGDEIQFGGGFWSLIIEDSYVFSDGDLPLVKLDSISAQQLFGNGKLEMRVITSTVIGTKPYVALELKLIGNEEGKDFVDLSKLTGIGLKLRGSSNLRMNVITQDLMEEESGFYGVKLDLNAGWREILIPTSSILPESYSQAEKDGWDFSHGAKAAYSLRFVVNGRLKDVTLEIEYIRFYGIDQSVFIYNNNVEAPKDGSLPLLQLGHSSNFKDITFDQKRNAVLFTEAGLHEIKFMGVRGDVLFETSGQHNSGWMEIANNSILDKQKVQLIQLKINGQTYIFKSLAN